jgi:hypothetical protein
VLAKLLEINNKNMVTDFLNIIFDFLRSGNDKQKAANRESN